SSSAYSPFGIVHTPISFFAQNGPPGWTRNTSSPSPRLRYISRPALTLAISQHYPASQQTPAPDRTSSKYHGKQAHIAFFPCQAVEPGIQPQRASTAPGISCEASSTPCSTTQPAKPAARSSPSTPFCWR